MRDPVAEVLRQRASLESGAGLAVAVSVLLHGGLTALAVYAALHAPAPAPARMVNIEFASMPATSAPAAKPARAAAKPATPPPAPKQEQPKLEAPKPAPPATVTAPPEKNTVPLSPFGRSTKKGSENPETRAPRATPAPAVPGAATTTGPTVADIPVGGSGVTGLEGGDFPYAQYLEAMQRRIGTNWFRPAGAGVAPVVVYFRIQRDGRITDTNIELSSGNGVVDRAARSAVQSSSPLNPLPPGYTGTYLGVRLTFR